MPTRMTRWLAAALLSAGACSGSAPRQYELEGQILLIDQGRQEVTIKHGDIPQFMPGMTMAFKVQDRALLGGRIPGEIVRATLVVADAGAHLTRIERIGQAPLPDDAPAAPRVATVEPGQQVADVSLTDETGTSRRLSEWRGKTVALTFMYSGCPIPTFCPLMDRYFKAVQDQVQADAALRDRVQLLSISIDPDRDTPAALARHAKALGADAATWRFLTGPAADVDGFAAQFGVSTMRKNPLDLMHNLRTAVVRGDGTLAIILNGSEWTPSDLVGELRNASAAR